MWQQMMCHEISHADTHVLGAVCVSPPSLPSAVCENVSYLAVKESDTILLFFF